jgi:flavin-dependent dehydrogenase
MHSIRAEQAFVCEMLATPRDAAAEATTCDVLVIGGGPAGSTVATLLAKQGRRVVIVEKAHHPRFHIGESLLPASGELFDALGVREDVERVGLQKWGAEFIATDSANVGAIQFGEAWNKSMPYAWQVKRADLDDILFKNAGRQGAQTVEGCRIREVTFDDDGATVRGEMDDGTQRSWRASYVVDASGRDTFLSQRTGAKRKLPNHASSALYAHFTGAKRHEGCAEGNISIYWFQHGWFWFIPLKDGTTSIGAVCWPHYLKSRDKPLKDFLMDTIAMAPKLAARLEGAQVVGDKVWATGNYSYTSTQCTGPRYAMLGDAFAFVDPVFSSGVHLAVNSGFAVQDLVNATLDKGPNGLLTGYERKKFEKQMTKGPRQFSWFIFRMTNPVMRNLLLNPRNPLRMKEALISLLAGDLYGRTPIWASLRALKGVYWAGQVANIPQAVRAYKRRKFNIRDMGAVPGENVMDAT